MLAAFTLIILSIIWGLSCFASAPTNPPENLIPRCQFVGNAEQDSAQIIRVEGYVGKTKYYFFTRQSCANGKAGYAWTVFKHENKIWQKIDPSIHFNDAWQATLLSRNEHYLVHFWPTGSQLGQFIGTYEKDGRLLQERMGEISFVADGSNFFWDWVGTLPKLGKTKISTK
jgi:hypothetical protein